MGIIVGVFRVRMLKYSGIFQIMQRSNLILIETKLVSCSSMENDYGLREISWIWLWLEYGLRTHTIDLFFVLPSRGRKHAAATGHKSSPEKGILL